MADRPCALRRSPPDPRDWMYRAARVATAASAPPPSVDWTTSLPPVRDQGSEGTCAAHAGACVKEAQERVDTGAEVRMSPRFLYTLRDDVTVQGMYLRNLMSIMSSNGVCTEGTCPYVAAVTAAARDEASNYKIQAYAQVATLAEMKAALAEQGPCVVAFSVYDFGGRYGKSLIYLISNAITSLVGVVASARAAFLDPRIVCKGQGITPFTGLYRSPELGGLFVPSALVQPHPTEPIATMWDVSTAPYARPQSCTILEVHERRPFKDQPH